MILIELIIVATIIIGALLLIWILQGVKVNGKLIIKVVAASMLVIIVAAVTLSSSRNRSIKQVLTQVEDLGGSVIFESHDWAEELPEPVKPIADFLAGKASVKVDLSHTDIRDISFLRELPSLTEIDIRGTYVTEYQIGFIRRKFNDCEFVR